MPLANQPGAFLCLVVQIFSTIIGHMRIPRIEHRKGTSYTLGSDMRERVGLLLKCCAFAVLAVMVLSGKPPSHAQTITTPPDSIQAAEQNMAIGANAANVASVQKLADKNASDVVELKTQQAATDSKVTIFGGMFLALQGGGIVLTMRRKKED